MTRRDVQLIGSLVDYVNDIKPYHTKLREFASEIIFQDTCNVGVIDDHHNQIYMQNMWSRDDIGCNVLSKISEGSDADRYFRIPAAVWPHFSINDSLNYGQTPKGDDPASPDLTDSNNDGKPDYEDPWIQAPNTSHFQGADWIPVEAIIVDYTLEFNGAVSKNGETYTFTYSVQVQVDSHLEDLYGIGNTFQAFVNGADVTFNSARSDIGTFDSDDFDQDPYDSDVRSIEITNLTATYTLTQADIDIFPTVESQTDNWVAQYIFARFHPKINIFYTNTGRYKVPFHQGTRVYVDGVQAVFGSTYMVESSRDFIQFMPGKKPDPRATISVNIMTVDRLFISETYPFDVNPTQNLNPNWIPYADAGFDELPFDDLPYDVGLPNTVSDYFTFKVDDVYPGRISPVSFMNSTTTEGKATLTVTDVNYTALNGEIYLICAVGLWTFTVQQVAPYRGAVTYGSFKQPWTNGKVTFIVDKTWVPYYMVPDNNTYTSYASVFQLYNFKTVDPTDQLVNLKLKTEHGVVVDPFPDLDGRVRRLNLHAPVELANFGKIMKVVDVGSLTRGWIGIETQDMYGSQPGVMITSLDSSGPAAAAGLLVGDIILTVEGVQLKNTASLIQQIGNFAPGKTISITVLRDNQSITYQVIVSSDLNNLEYYQFVLNEIPTRGVYYEIKVEQTGGLNQRVHTGICDDVVITVLEDGNSFMYTEIYNSRLPITPDAESDNNGDPVTYVDPDYVDRDYVD